MNASNLGICTMPGCLTQAQWVHGNPIEGGAPGCEEEVFPWELCDCCHESTVAADRVLGDAKIDPPDDMMWCLEAARARLQRLRKLEALKKA